MRRRKNNSVVFNEIVSDAQADSVGRATVGNGGNFLPVIGENYQKNGIYIGTWAPKGLGKIFNVFAAPEDLNLEKNGWLNARFCPEDLEEAMPELKNWHGFDGTDYRDDKGLIKAIANGAYKGEWVLPPRELIDGRDGLGKKTGQKDHLFEHQHKGLLKDTLRDHGEGGLFGGCYLSSTEHTTSEGSFWCVYFPKWEQVHGQRYNMYARVRPIRLVEIKK